MGLRCCLPSCPSCGVSSRTAVWMSFVSLLAIDVAMGAIAVEVCEFIKNVAIPASSSAVGLKEPLRGLYYYVAGAAGTETTFLVLTFFTLGWKASTRNGVNAWYGFLLGSTFYTMFVLIGLGMFIAAFHHNFQALHDYYVSNMQDGLFGKTERDNSKALEALAFAAASVHAVMFFILLFWRDTICGETLPARAARSRFAPQAPAAPAPKKSFFSRSKSSANTNAFQGMPLNGDQARSDVEMAGSDAGGSSLRFGADRFAQP